MEAMSAMDSFEILGIPLTEESTERAVVNHSGIQIYEGGKAGPF